MHTLKLIGRCLAACLPSLALAAPVAPALGERALREECSAAPSQAGMRDCLATKAQSSQRALQHAEERVASTLSQWDEDGRYVSEAKARLAASHQAFSKYREAQCDLSASLSGGSAGNAREIRRLACVAELNGRRTEQLSNAVSDLPLK